MVGKADEVIKWLLSQDREKTFEVKPYHPKRSLNANAFCWHLCNEMANVLRTSKDEVYQEMLPKLPLRYVLADDPGAGKTIMTGLFIKELIARGDLKRCLIVAPGSLAEIPSEI